MNKTDYIKLLEAENSLLKAEVLLHKEISLCNYNEYVKVKEENGVLGSRVGILSIELKNLDDLYLKNVGELVSAQRQLKEKQIFIDVTLEKERILADKKGKKWWKFWE